QEATLPRGGAPALVEIFGDYARARHRGRTLFDQNRRGSRRVEHQELGPALPDPLFDQLWRYAVFLKDEAHEAGMRANRMMEQRQHCAATLGTDPGSDPGSDLGNTLAEKSALPHDLRRIALTKKLWSKPASKATGTV